MKDRMYQGVKTWNPFVGCGWGCVYCRPSFQAILKRFSKCQMCRDYMPHEHPERLDKIPHKPVIFVCGNGDISFTTLEYRKRIYAAMRLHSARYPDTEWMLQSKNPGVFVDEESFWPDRTWVGTTLETNRDTKDYSTAPFTIDRASRLASVSWPNKFVTVEPVTDFDECLLRGMILLVQPRRVYIGYNSRPGRVHLPEPPLLKTLQLIRNLRNQGIEVIEKELREAVI